MNVDTGEFRALRAEITVLSEEIRQMHREFAVAEALRIVTGQAFPPAPQRARHAAAHRSRPPWLRPVDDAR